MVDAVDILRKKSTKIKSKLLRRSMSHKTTANFSSSASETTSHLLSDISFTSIDVNVHRNSSKPHRVSFDIGSLIPKSLSSHKLHDLMHFDTYESKKKINEIESKDSLKGIKGNSSNDVNFNNSFFNDDLAINFRKRSNTVKPNFRSSINLANLQSHSYSGRIVSDSHLNTHRNEMDRSKSVVYPSSHQLTASWDSYPHEPTAYRDNRKSALENQFKTKDEFNETSQIHLVKPTSPIEIAISFLFHFLNVFLTLFIYLPIWFCIQLSKCTAWFIVIGSFSFCIYAVYFVISLASEWFSTNHY